MKTTIDKILKILEEDIVQIGILTFGIFVVLQINGKSDLGLILIVLFWMYYSLLKKNEKAVNNIYVKNFNIPKEAKITFQQKENNHDR